MTSRARAVGPNKKSPLGVLYYGDKTDLAKFSAHAIEIPGTRPEGAVETGIYRSALLPMELLKDYPTVKVRENHSTAKTTLGPLLKHLSLELALDIPLWIITADFSTRLILATAFQTVYDAFETGLLFSKKDPFLGHRPTVKDPATKTVRSGPYVWQTYEQVAQRRLNFGSGLMNIWVDDVKGDPNKKWNLGIYAVNRPEWMIADLACHAYSLATVALYDTLGPDSVEFIIGHSECSVVLCSLDKVELVLQIAHKCPNLKVIISMDSAKDVGASTPSIPNSSAVLKSWAAEKGVKFYEFKEVEALGAKNKVPVRPPTPDDICTVCYTSGTTGNPKGALISHGNVIAVVRAGEFVGNNVVKEDVHISYLPLAHIMERVISTCVIIRGARIGFFRGDVTLLIEDLGVLRPTIFPSVPRLLNRIHDKIMAAALHSGSAVKAALFSRALAAKLENMKTTGSLTHPLWDRLVFNKIKALLGGRIRFMLSASAPVSPDVLAFLRVVFCCDVVESYGQTESTGPLSLSWKSDLTPGHVGAVVPCNELKLVSVPEMSYTILDKPYPRGEICVRGPNVFKGYLKDPEKTKETVDEDGWLHTGDIGYVDAIGRVSIIDRKKNILKLSQGEYVSPEKIENVYIKSGFIAQIFVHGDSLKNDLVAIVVPDQEFSIPFAINSGLLPANTPVPTVPQQPGEEPHPSLVELCKVPELRNLILKDMNKLAKEAKLRGFEFVKRIHVTAEMFSVQNGLLTPTFKVKRHEAKNYYRQYIDEMYHDIDNGGANVSSKL
ncbi:hypothetical protein HK102_010942 [Quaeritorhiza haematococci]|nr:hypothetical protein HK102_010942 [Quaeritorhiza haematococci]